MNLAVSGESNVFFNRNTSKVDSLGIGLRTVGKVLKCLGPTCQFTQQDKRIRCSIPAIQYVVSNWWNEKKKPGGPNEQLHTPKFTAGVLHFAR